MHFWSPGLDPGHPLVGSHPERYVLRRLTSGRYIAIDLADREVLVEVLLDVLEDPGPAVAGIHQFLNAGGPDLDGGELRQHEKRVEQQQQRRTDEQEQQHGGRIMANPAR